MPHRRHHRSGLGEEHASYYWHDGTGCVAPEQTHESLAADYLNKDFGWPLYVATGTELNTDFSFAHEYITQIQARELHGILLF